MEEKKEIEFRSEEVQEVLGERPRRLVQYGNGLLVVILALFIGVGSSVSFPEVRNHPVVLGKSDSGQLNGLFRVTAAEIGKINIGQRVLVELDVYPKARYGVLETVVDSLSLLPTEHQYAVRVSVPRTGCTNEGKPLELQAGMEGTATVQIPGRSLLRQILPKIP